jgi:hypothetical protein
MNAFNKIASLLSTLTLGATLAFAGTGCVIDASAGTTVVTEPAIDDVTVDTGATMATSPGEGVGLFIEYAGDGHWDVYTTCDTDISGAACSFDVIITPDSRTVSNIEGYDLYASDSVSLLSDGSIQLVADTDYGMNGVSFDADPGATIQVDMLLDGVEQPRFVYAVSDGALVSGVRTNPAAFTPATP